MVKKVWVLAIGASLPLLVWLWGRYDSRGVPVWAVGYGLFPGYLLIAMTPPGLLSHRSSLFLTILVDCAIYSVLTWLVWEAVTSLARRSRGGQP